MSTEPLKVLCFDTLLQVLILKGLTLHQNCAEIEHFGEEGLKSTKVHPRSKARVSPPPPIWMNIKRKDLQNLHFVNG